MTIIKLEEKDIVFYLYGLTKVSPFSFDKVATGEKRVDYCPNRKIQLKINTLPIDESYKNSTYLGDFSGKFSAVDRNGIFKINNLMQFKASNSGIVESQDIVRKIYRKMIEENIDYRSLTGILITEFGIMDNNKTQTPHLTNEFLRRNIGKSFNNYRPFNDFLFCGKAHFR